MYRPPSLLAQGCESVGGGLGARDWCVLNAVQAQRIPDRFPHCRVCPTLSTSCQLGDYGLTEFLCISVQRTLY